MSPQHAQQVVVRLPDAVELSGRVDVVGADGAFSIVLAVRPERGLRSCAGVVEYLTPTGIHRVAGSLTPDAGDPSVLRLTPAGAEVEQRRDWARADVVVPVGVRFDDPRLGPAATVAINVSGGGALIRDPVGLELGTIVHLELLLDAAPIRVRGRVVREAPGGAKGLVLEDVAEADRERIVRFVTARQIAELRLRRGRG